MNRESAQASMGSISLRPGWSGWLSKLYEGAVITAGSRTALTGAVLFAIFATFLVIVQFSTPDLAGNDGYYHIKLAYLMRTEGIRPAFDWLPLTVLNSEEYVDHHFLYHMLLMPFTLGDLRMGAKVASVLFPTLTFLAVWWLLRGQQVPYATLWSLGLLGVSEAFIYRMSMPRAQSLSLAVLVLALHWLLSGKYWRMLPLAFLYVWLYNAFPLILILTGVYVGVRWLTDRRLSWQALIYTGAGIGLGLLINPYFPDNLIFLYRHIMPKLADPTATKVGSEWYPYNTTQLMENSGLALVAFVSGIVALGLHDRRMDIRAASSLFLSILFGVMLFQSRRFVEYFPAFALIFAAMAWSPLVQRWLAEGIGQTDPGFPPGQTLPLPGLAATRYRIASLAIGLLMIAIWLPALWLNLGASRESLQDSKPYERYAGAAAWLQNNTPTGSRVFQTDWDDFPRLFFYNSHNTYTLGLDPTYMQLYDAALYDLWVDISKGKIENPATIISQEFGANFIFSDLDQESFLREAERDSNLQEMYRDEYAVVFSVKQANQNP